MKTALAEKIRKLDVSHPIQGVRVGKIVSVDDNGRVRVDFPGNIRGPVASKITGAVKATLENAAAPAFPDVLLAFENDDPGAPVIIDALHEGVDPSKKASDIALEIEKSEDVVLDGKRVSFNAKEEIVLTCGRSSVTLTSAGKVLIRGAYLLNRSSGVNKIKGGSVQIN